MCVRVHVFVPLGVHLPEMLYQKQSFWNFCSQLHIV